MTDTITTNLPEFTRSEITHIVMAAHPDLIEALERASEEYYRHEESWQEEVARHQRAAGMPKRSLESPHGRALRQAATAVTKKFEEMLASGQIVLGNTGRSDRGYGSPSRD